ncbi:P-loop ATPase, Sll1717 family [Streptomyces caniscabiei]|uniref:KAP NTPase domain-containing protein n=1 Tax=Streptomyces caniscabiei TaxID=2746961 RepID=A0ABU4N5X8_9ACTN|nr:hypothetical protein [Streptomyces caniscabiei]MBE4741994.1 hypothetical protein [Streptomyces caniscabiei]MBE4762760.1 hypothetical protein [Streptomyces caniscabiei]MBE4790811.1 hypothetical protein [Streptomyces caniscabiei]MBE4799992.1 hypothetical protein [Streptomyces caniscabiei]MDX2949073.1 hypothetical protein [Streptomyces caniscabiei]
MSRGQTYFGDRDASLTGSSDLVAHHVFRGIQDSIKWNDRAHGIEVVVGMKGSGKTELRRYLQACTGASVYVFNLDDTHAYLDSNVSTVRGNSGRTKNAIATVLLAEFARRISESGSSPTRQALRSAFERTKSILQGIPGAVDINVAGVANIRLGDLLKRESPSDVLQSTLDDLITGISSALSDEEKGAILIDEVEVVFDGISENPLFLEGVVRAVVEINARAEEKIHVILFIKQGLWKSWYEDQREYDRVSDRLGFITWDHPALVELIAKRIARLHGLPWGTMTSEQLWAKEFTWDGGFDKFTRYCTQYCASGPRDMIALCNYAAAKTPSDERISLQHINACLGTYSQDKVNGLNGDFGETYRGINKFVEKVFREFPATMTSQDLVRQIESQIASGIHGEFLDAQWYMDGTKEDLAGIAYEVGVVGYQTPERGVYAIEDPELSASDLLDKEWVCIHPAFRRHLRITGS